MSTFEDDGIYAFDGFTYKSIHYQPDFGINIQTTIDAMDKNKLHEAWGFNDVAKGRFLLAYTKSGDPRNSDVIVWDYKRNAISFYNTMWINTMLYYKDLTLFSFSAGDGSPIKKIGGLSNDGNAISVECKFPWWDIGADKWVRFHHLNIDTTIQGLHSAGVTIEMDDESISKALEAYADDVVAEVTATNFSSTGATATAGGWDLSSVVAGMWAYVDSTKVGLITAVNDGANSITVDDWDGGGGTPDNLDGITIRGSSWGSEAWVQVGSAYRITKSIHMIDSDSVKLIGRQIRLLIEHGGVSQPITIHGIEVYFSTSRRLTKLPETIEAEMYDSSGDAV